MALVAVKIVNGSGQTIGRMLEDDGEELAYLRTLVKREVLESVEIVKPAASTARKPAAK